MRHCPCACARGLSHVRLSMTLGTAAHQALSMGFSRQEHWSGLPCPPPRGLPGPEVELMSPAAPALAGRLPPSSPPLSVKFCQMSLQSFSAKGSCPESQAPFHCQASFCLGPRHGLPWPFSSWSLLKIVSLLFCYMPHDLGLSLVSS